MRDGKQSDAQMPAAVHVGDAGLDVEAPGPHLVEARRLHRPLVTGPPDDGVEPDVRVEVALVDPGLRAPVGLDEGRRSSARSVGIRPSNRSAGSIRWSSTEITPNRRDLVSGSGRSVTARPPAFHCVPDGRCPAGRSSNRRHHRDGGPDVSAPPRYPAADRRGSAVASEPSQEHPGGRPLGWAAGFGRSGADGWVAPIWGGNGGRSGVGMSVESLTWSSVGPYERGFEQRIGAAVVALDPNHPANRSIVDLDKAARDGDGLVRVETDVVLLVAPRPAGLLHVVANRGMVTALPYGVGEALSMDPSGRIESGDGWLLDRGTSVLWVGWQWDVSRRPGAVGIDAPDALDGAGRPIHGQARLGFQPLLDTPRRRLADVVLPLMGEFHPLPAADLDEPDAVL